jgi:hypothetical protein
MLMIFTPGVEYFEQAKDYANRSREELKAFQIRQPLHGHAGPAQPLRHVPRFRLSGRSRMRRAGRT